MKIGSKKRAGDISLAPCLSILGTGSDVGKSVLVTGLCRYFSNQGVRVAPFKAQNMSNNSGVTPEGLEMGRAQIVQAEAARIAPQVDMNPILLKPTSDVGSQVVLLGKAVAHKTALAYHHEKKRLWATACDALDRVRAQYDLVVIEGAGSCAEVNLMEQDLVNFKVAHHADAPVILVADIHRGGVFAQIVGTLACIDTDCQDRVAGFIINRFRGDLRLIQEGVRWIAGRTAKPSLGVVPWYRHLVIEAEDSVVIEQPRTVSVNTTQRPAVAVIRTPHISNFTDFDPLGALDGLNLYFLERRQDLSAFRAVILPGSKNTRFDLQWLIAENWNRELTAFAAANGNVLGICGGYQMMGISVHDPQGIEGEPGSSNGLGLLPVETFLRTPKTTTRTQFSWNGVMGDGYEIHMGRTQRTGGKALFKIHSRNGRPGQGVDGCRCADSSVMGTYMHGLFDTPAITRQWLDTIGLKHLSVPNIHGPQARDRNYEKLAAHLQTYLNMQAIEELV